MRPLGNEYQVLSGHHRKAAAMKAGIDAVPCWVRELDDEAAYMALVTSNSQGELSPLEIGMHALGLDMDKRGKGAAGGGLKGYAESIGKDPANITRCRQAAAVVRAINCNDAINALNDKTAHLAAIHALPSECWPDAVASYPELTYLAAPIRRRKSFANAAGLGLSVLEAKPKDTKAIQEVKALARMVLHVG